jgi:branched-chain amino acid aminotransferase
MANSSRVVYWNGEFIPESEARLSIYDSALMFGDMVFEMTRSFNGTQFKLREHLERLMAGVKILRIPLEMTIEQLEEACLATVEANKPSFAPDDEHRLMIDVTRGLLGIYQGVVGIKACTNIIIADFPLRWTVASMGSLFDNGINAVITSQRAVPAQYLDPKIKNRSRIYYLIANIQASLFAGENNWALLLDQNGFIAEGTGDNFFIVKNGRVITPPGKNILRGISRDYVMHELCPQLGIPALEKNIDPYDVHTADEAFMTGTPFCLLPVTSLDGLPIGLGKPGAIATRILNRWSENAGIDIAQQIKNWNIDTAFHPKTATPYSFPKRAR